jgi:hypothetical protein
MGRIRVDGGAERINNTKDEYAPLVRQFGYPDSILSTENDTGKDKPIVPTRIARYNVARVNVALVPIGCVGEYVKAAAIINDTYRSSALSQAEIKRLRAHPCKPSGSGYTIVGYVDSSDNTALSADLAGISLKKIKDKRTIEPVEDQDGKNVAGKKTATKGTETPTGTTTAKGQPFTRAQGAANTTTAPAEKKYTRRRNSPRKARKKVVKVRAECRR